MDRPNVLLVVLDSVRKDHLSTYGYDRPTSPVLDGLAERATRYDQAISAAPWTPPSHGAMFTGRYPSHNGVFGITPHLDPEQPHVAERFAAAGYRTVGFSNSYHTSPDRGFDRGFDYYHDILSLPRFAGTMYEPSLDFAKHLFDYFVRGYDDSSFQLRRLLTQIDRADDPFFGFINMNSAHSPYDPPERFKTEFEAYFDAWDAVDEEAATAVSEDAYRYVLGDVEMSDVEWDLLRCWYDGEIRYMDALLGKLFEFLKARDLFEETLIVVTSDHGEQFGEDGLVYHQFSLSETLINVPLLVKWPGDSTGEVSDELVSLVDLAPTALEVATGQAQPDMDGRNFRDDDPPSAVFAEYAGPNESLRQRFADHEGDFESLRRGYQAIRTPRHKLVRASDGETTLYDVTDGESEIHDDQLAAELLERLDTSLGDLPTVETDERLDDHVEEHLERMGYL